MKHLSTEQVAQLSLALGMEFNAQAKNGLMAFADTLFGMIKPSHKMKDEAVEKQAPNAEAKAEAEAKLAEEAEVAAFRVEQAKKAVTKKAAAKTAK